MFQRLIDDLKDSISTAMRLTSLATAAAIALSIGISFLCAAAFVYVLQNYGLMPSVSPYHTPLSNIGAHQFLRLLRQHVSQRFLPAD